MTDKLISYQTAKLAKEKGFNEPSYVYQENGGYIPNITNIEREIIEDARDKYTYAPTQSSLQKWLREEYNIDVNLSCYGELEDFIKLKKTYTCRIDNWNKILSVHDGTALVMPEHFHFEDETPEVVLEKGLQEALKLIK